MELVRAIMLFLEKKTETAPLNGSDIELEGYSENQIDLHLNIMAEAGFLVCEPMRSSTNRDRIIRTLVFELSWAGHEYLDTIRDPVIWKRTKAGLSKIGNSSFGLAMELAKGIAFAKARELGILI